MSKNKKSPARNNAVAPDWNLKVPVAAGTPVYTVNAVAPDWNLKMSRRGSLETRYINAVAPDWNLKTNKLTRLAMI